MKDINDIPLSSPECVRADWPASDRVVAFTTTRNDGVSVGSYSSFNLASHVEDQPDAVISNRQLLSERFDLPAEPVWLQQTHSNRVVVADCERAGVEADASWTTKTETVCAVLTADCLPVFFSTQDGSRVAVAHAGWRGLHNGIITATATALAVPAQEILVWLGPAIGPQAFEVGADVVQMFHHKDVNTAQAFTRKDEHHWLCDVYQLANIELNSLGIENIYGGGLCTYSDRARFYSHRRVGAGGMQSGRMASLIWLQE